MSLKRCATTELNHDNWDSEETPEEKGNFIQAPVDELKNRIIKKARRKLTATGNDQNDGKSPVFNSFKGFNSCPIASTSTVTSSCSTFSFLSKLSSSSSSSPQSASITGSKLSSSENEKCKKTDNNDSGVSTDLQFSRLKALNLAVSNWIKENVEKNSICILTPIFKDYEKYLSEIQNQNSENSNSNNSNRSIDKVNSNQNIQKQDDTSTTSSILKSDTSPALMANTPSTETTVKNNNTFNFNNQFPSKNENLKFSGFNFASTSNNKPFTFNLPMMNQNPLNSSNDKKNLDITTTSEVVSENNNDNNDDDDEPPKVEYVPIVEENSIYSKKCKVFTKTSNNYSDLGVGTLHLKSVENSGKTQLIVRANTNIGKILLNLILNDGIPTQKVGKNNVMLCCIPTPESSIQKPIPILLRVKTEDEANELLKTINKYKK